VKSEFEKITKEVNILIKKAKHIRRYNYTTEQNLELIEGSLEGLQESLVAYLRFTCTYKIYAHKENNRHTENILGMYFHSFIV
jgi:hypothetical protein